MSRLQAEALDKEGGVQLGMRLVGAEAKHWIAVHVQEALRGVDGLAEGTWRGAGCVICFVDK